VVAFETFKLAPYQSAEEAHEAWGGGAKLEDLFDVTPATSITSYATDEGMYEPDEIAALVDQTPYLREGYELLRSGAR
jgi:translation initiation factor 2B subunit (eIF-2B alpha/beta/delta family)